MIQPTYVTFEQAKKLEELGLSAKSDKYWVMMTKDKYTEMSDVQLEDLDHSVGIGGNLVVTKYQQWQVVEWLRVNHNIWITTPYSPNDRKPFCWIINTIGQEENDDNCWISGIDTEDQLAGFGTPQEAYSAAFDYILTNLI